MLAQRVLLPVTRRESWTVLGNDGPVQPIGAVSGLPDRHRAVSGFGQGVRARLKGWFVFLAGRPADRADPFRPHPITRDPRLAVARSALGAYALVCESLLAAVDRRPQSAVPLCRGLTISGCATSSPKPSGSSAPPASAPTQASVPTIRTKLLFAND